MSLKKGSLYKNLEDRVLENTMQASNIASRVTSLEVATTDLASRVVALEGFNDRLSSIETWRGARSPSITNAGTNLPENNNLLMGLTTLVGAVNTTNARVNEHGSKINTILSVLRNREMIAA